MAGEIDQIQDVERNHFNFYPHNIMNCIEKSLALIIHFYEEKHQSPRDFLCEDLSHGVLVVISGDMTQLWNMKWNIR